MLMVSHLFHHLAVLIDPRRIDALHHWFVHALTPSRFVISHRAEFFLGFAIKHVRDHAPIAVTSKRLIKREEGGTERVNTRTFLLRAP